MFKRFILYIEQEPWDEAIERQDKYINRGIAVVLALAVIYFCPVIYHIFTR
jgi:hypothetical protein